MRYELGVLQLLVASGGKRNPARVEVVERALGARPGSLDPAIRVLRGRGLVNDDGQPTSAGVTRARGLSRHVRDAIAASFLPSRLPPASGVFEKDARDTMNDHDERTIHELTVKKHERRSA